MAGAKGASGGARTGAGRKKKPLAEKILDGQAKTAKVIDFGGVAVEDMPRPDEYLSAQQKNGKPFGADKIYKETWEWLKERGCETLVNKRLIEAYSQTFARYIQCEDAISSLGFIGKHPTTGGIIASPFVAMSQSFQKQANLMWCAIFEVVKDNCATSFSGNTNDDIMERLLTARK
jgi:phage terminase small subunit